MRAPIMNSVITLLAATALTLLAASAFAALQSNQQQQAVKHLVERINPTPVQFEYATQSGDQKPKVRQLQSSEWQPRPAQRLSF